MACRPAPACVAMLEEATRLWPARSQASDGICGDARHLQLHSDHNLGNAADLTHDPAHGCDAHALVARLAERHDGRVKYIISNRRIWTPDRGWRTYFGINPHNKHAHVSIWPEWRGGTGPWWEVTIPSTLKEASKLIRNEAIAIRPTPSGNGYYIAARNGGIYPFGDAIGLGSLYEHVEHTASDDALADIAVTPTGRGYWLLSTDGGVFPFGDAVGRGSAFGDIGAKW